MNRSETARLPLLDALLSVGPEGTTREDLIQRSGTSNASFYRIVKPLLQEALVEAIGPRYRLLLSQSYNYRYKLWRDTGKLHQLEPDLRQQIEDVVQEALETLNSSLQSLWLVGSMAHGTNTKESDFDFLAVVHPEKQFLPRRVSREVQFVTMSVSKFQRKFEAGDSFVLSALRYGLLLEDRRFAQTWLDRPQKVKLDNEEIQAVHSRLSEIRSRLLYFIQLQETEEAFRFLKAYATTLGRALLAFFHELPAGKADLMRNLDIYYGDNPISGVLQRLQNGNVSDQLLELNALENYWSAFLNQRGHLNIGIHYPYTNGLQFNHDSVVILTRALGLTERDRIETDQIDLCYEINGHPVYFQLESTFGEIREENIKRFGSGLRNSISKRGQDLRLVVIANPQNKVKVTNRQWRIPPEIEELCNRYKITIISSCELLRLHNQIQLTQQGQRDLLECLGITH